jgi:hypothetical protein
MSYSLDDYVSARFASLTHNKASKDELVSLIHPQIRFRRNSLNLWIGKVGSGKSYGLALEIEKLDTLPNNGGYGLLLYVTDNPSDETYLKVRPVLEQHMLVKRCSYEEANEMINEIAIRKDAYKEVRRKNLAHRLTDESRENILAGIGCSNFDAETSHSIVVFDDCMGAFKKNSALFKKLFESRHPNITYFLITQDPLGVPSEIKTNIHSLVLFGGLPKQKIKYIAHRPTHP